MEIKPAKKVNVVLIHKEIQSRYGTESNFFSAILITDRTISPNAFTMIMWSQWRLIWVISYICNKLGLIMVSNIVNRFKWQHDGWVNSSNDRIIHKLLLIDEYQQKQTTMISIASQMSGVHSPISETFNADTKKIH